MPMSATPAADARAEVWKLTGLLALAFAALTTADIQITLWVLAAGLGTELNPAAQAGSGIDVGFLVAANLAVLMPLTGFFALALVRAREVPADTVDRWWAHAFRITRPFSHLAKRRAPLRLASAALTMLAFKCVVVLSNVMGVLGLPSLLSELGLGAQMAGLSDRAAYGVAYAAVIIPCYVAGAGMAAALLRQLRAPPAVVRR